MLSKNIFAFGCSFTKDNYQETWADLVAKDYNLKLVNCAERGAGSEYVINRLLTENISSHDLVAIMWPSADRLDLWADDNTPHLLDDCKYSSWPDGKSPKFVDYNGKYQQEFGFNLNGSVPRGYKHKFYKYFYTAHSAVHKWYVNIITAQLYLKKINVKYVMCSAFPMLNPIHYHHENFKIQQEIYNKINLKTFVNNSEHFGFFTFCQKNKLPFLDNQHPSTESHRQYVNTVLKSKIQSLIL
jgi:hypothetical protein